METQFHTFLTSALYKNLRPSLRSSNFNPGKMPHYLFIRGNVVAKLVQALRYKPEGRGFDSRFLEFLIDIHPAALWP